MNSKVKKILIILAILILLSAGSIPFFFILGRDKTTYKLESKSFNNVIAFNSHLSLNNLSIIREHGDDYEVIEITEDMIVSENLTDSVGQKQLVIKYGDETFVVNITVKYKVEFKVNNEVIDTQYVMSKDEIVIPEDPRVDGLNFIGWGIDTSSLKNNVSYNAYFTMSDNRIPKLLTLNATYGDTLSDLKLPANIYGNWVFVDDLTTTVGNAGSNKFKVRFEPNDSQVAVETREVTIKVAKKEIEFTNVVESFTFDGTIKSPLYRLENNVSNVKYTPYYLGDAIGVGEYAYELDIEDDNYMGSYFGKLKINKANVSITVSDKDINFGDDCPDTFEYFVHDAEGSPLSEDLLKLLNVTIVKPNYLHAGNYLLNVQCDHVNFNTIIYNGYLKVNKVELNLDKTPPTFVGGAKVTYGSVLKSVVFEDIDLRGVWTWKNPNLKILTDTSVVVKAVFVPYADKDYLTTEKDVTLSVEKKKITIEIPEQSFVYDGLGHTLRYNVVGLEGSDVVEVLGNRTETTAGEYDVNLTIDDKRYIASTDTKLVIDQASISDFSTVYDVVWNKTLRLSDIPLISGYEWVEDSIPVENIGEQGFLARFTPEDTVNYKTEEKLLKIRVAKANCTILTPNDYEFKYSPNGYTLDNITLPHTEEDVVYKYYLNGKEVSSITSVGDYTVKLSIKESTHYNATEKSFSVKVDKCPNNDVVILNVSATYGDLLSKFQLPESELGSWKWGSVVVGNAGVRKHTAIFTPTDTFNYEEREVVVTFDVAKKVVQSPTIQSSTYSGKSQTAVVEYNPLYSVVTNNGGVDGGDYNVILELTDSDNYCWEKENEDKQKTLTFTIVKNTTNVWTKVPTISGWTYGEKENSPESDSTFGDVVVEYKLVTDDDSKFTTTKPSRAGNYIARFRVDDCGSYNGLDNVTVEFSIDYVEVSIPTINAKTFNGALQSADISTNKFYSVIKNELVTNAGEYDVVIKLNNESYKWTDSYELEKTIKFKIDKIVNKDEYVSSYSATYEDLIETYALPTNDTGVWSWVGEEVVGDAGTVVRTAKFTPKDTLNYEPREVSVTFNIAKKVVQIPIISATTFNGNTQTAVISDTDKYTVKENNGGTDAGVYDVIVELKDSNNYRWAQKDTEKQIEIPFEIVKNEANVWEVAPTIGDWTYGEGCATPVYTSKYGNVVVEYKLLSESEEKYTQTSPTKAGSYVARFTVADSINYNKLVAEVEFDIAFVMVTAPTIASTVYNGSYQTANVKTSDKYTIMTENLSYKNAGTYSIKLKLNDESYKWTEGEGLEKTLYFVIDKVSNTDTVTTSYSAIYLDKLSKFSLPDSSTGTWSWKEGCDTVVGNVGKTTHTAVFTPDDTTNYVQREVAVSFEIAKKVVQLPIISSTTFTGEKQTASVDSSDEYVVVTNNGGIEKGFYDVVLQLKDSNNYRWAGNNPENTVTLKFEIAQNANNKWTVIPSITDGKYNQLTPVVSCDSVYGDIIVEYKLVKDDDDKYSKVCPENAGKYVARFTVIETDNYNGLVQEIEFEITPIVVTIPSISSSVYTGSVQTADITDTDYYEVVSNEEVTNAGNYDVKLKLKNNNYVWSDNTEDVENSDREKTLTFTIEKVVNKDEVTLSYTATYEDLLENYALPTNDTGVWSWVGTTVGNAGVNKHIAQFTPNDPDNYESREVEVTFTVNKKVVTLPNIPTATFNNSPQTAIVEESSLYVVLTNNGGTVKGEYDVVLALTDSDNYCWKKGDDSKETIAKFYILKNNENTWNTGCSPAMGDWTYYSGTPSSPVADAVYGEHIVEYKLKTDSDDKYSTTKPSAAGEYVARFTVADNISYNGLSQEVEFKIEHYTVQAPTISSKVYTGNTQTATISDSEFYDVTSNVGGKIVGDYSVTLTLKDESFKWTDSYEMDKNLTFKITQVINEDVVAESYAATYEDLLTTTKFALPENATGTWSWVGTTVGTVGTHKHQAVFTPIDTHNYAGRTVEVKFTVIKKEVATPNINPLPYIGSSQTTEIANTSLYNVVSQASGTVVGTYYATLELVDDANYCWKIGNNSKTTQVAFNIIKNTTNKWEELPTISEEWTYTETPTLSKGSASFGSEDITVVYKVRNADNSTYSATQPTAAGLYTVKFEVADNDNYNGVVKTIDFTINYLTIYVPTITNNNSTYTGSGQKAVIPDNSYYDIVTNNEVVEAGDYDVVLRINDDSCKWPDNFVKERTLTFTIVKATDNDWTTAPTMNHFTYTPTPLDTNKGVAVSKYGTVKVTYSVKDANSYSETLPTRVGSYEAKFEVVETLNCNGLYSYNGISKVIPFNINKATPVLSDLDIATVVYENATDTNKTVVNNAIKSSVPGTFAYTLPKLVTTSSAAYSKVTFNVTFTPNDTDNYLTTSGTASINMYTVCYIGSKYYGSIENALLNAVTGDNVIVIPNTTGKVTIATNSTIGSEVSLILPYVVDGVTKYNENGVAELQYQEGVSDEFKHLVLTNQVIIKSNITLTNNGTLLIAGERSGGAGGHGAAGHTARNFAELVLENNAKILSTGIVKLYGYIDESSDNNTQSSVTISSGTLYMPFIVSDHRGGTYMSTAYSNLFKKRVTPFNQWEFRNIVPKLILTSSATLLADANMTAQSAVHHAEVKFVGSDSTYFLQLTSGGRLEVKYRPNRSTSDATKYNNNRWDEGVMDMNFFGGAQTNALEMSVAGQDVSTANVDFPLTWQHKITLNSGNYKMTNSYKMMPGHVFTIKSDANLDAAKINIYTNEKYQDTITIYKAYRTDCADAKIILQGTLKVSNIGGNVYLEGTKASITASSTSYTTYEMKSSYTTKKVTLSLTKHTS